MRGFADEGRANVVHSGLRHAPHGMGLGGGFGMELVCPYCSAQMKAPPADGTCPVCGEVVVSSSAQEPAPVPVSTQIGVVPTAEDADNTRASGAALPEETGFGEDTVISGKHL